MNPSINTSSARGPTPKYRLQMALILGYEYKDGHFVEMVARV
jgi:hypothetical protein